MINRTILIVDDTVENLDILIELLKNYDVIDTTNGQDALNIAQNEKVDLVLLDIMMPNMNGYEVCKQLKLNPKTRNIPIIFITAKTDEKSIKKAFDLGGVDYITKPFLQKELLSRVKNHLALAKQTSLFQELVQKQQIIIKQNSDLKDIENYIKKLISKSNNIQKPIKFSDIKNSLEDIVYKINDDNKKIVYFNKSSYYNIQNKVLIENNKPISLSIKEKLLIELFITKINQTISIEDIVIHLWEDFYTKDISKDSVKSQVSKLRKKLPSGLIKNIYGIGYKLEIV